jgi:hypothetical protein
MRRLRALALCLSAWLSACSVAEYTIGGAADSAGACPEGQVVCGDGCAPQGECDDCPEGQVRCDGACVAAGACDDPGACPEGQVVCGDGCAAADTCACNDACDSDLEACDGGVCVCRPGLTRCGSACVDVRADADHCDGCGSPCAGAEVCQDGACIAACDAPRQACDGACVELASDSLNCGDCGELCRADELCLSGDCEPYSAIEGCDSCPCVEACESEDSDGEDLQCCDSPFLGGPVCVDADCP